MATLLVLLGAGTALATDPSRSTAAPPLTPRQRTILEAHIAKPWPTVKHGPTSDGWGQMNLAFARLALDPDNATVAASVNEEIVQWSIQFLPWDNYTVNAPLGGQCTQQTHGPCRMRGRRVWLVSQVCVRAHRRAGRAALLTPHWQSSMCRAHMV